ncbi:MAG TPA: hypothetical protein PK858_12630, partial [Saprospiraceae bacterium]|nr:hypothetical protein [Saprospiraceae bacterium]
MSIRLYTQSILLLLGLPWANMCLGQPPSAHTFRLDAWGLAERRIEGSQGAVQGGAERQLVAIAVPELREQQHREQRGRVAITPHP